MYSVDRFRIFLFSILLLCFGVISAADAQIIQPNCGAPVSSPDQDTMNPHTSFGCRNAGVPGASKYHKGTDYRCPMSSPLSAELMGDMSCKPRSDGNGAGNRCRIDGKGLNECIVIKYFHMDDAGFVPGFRHVNPGDSIGVSGQSGNGERFRPGMGAHLHFEIWIDNKPVGAQFYFSNYSGVNVCADNAIKRALWANADEDMRACPGQPGSGPGVPPQNPQDAEVANEGDDACATPPAGP